MTPFQMGKLAGMAQSTPRSIPKVTPASKRTSSIPELDEARRGGTYSRGGGLQAGKGFKANFRKPVPRHVPGAGPLPVKTQLKNIANVFLPKKFELQ